MATTSTLVYGTSTKTFTGGSTFGAGKGDTWKVTLATPGNANDELQLDINTQGQTVVMASGDVIGTNPVACITLSNRVYFVESNKLHFSALGDATIFEQQGIGAGYVDTNNNFAQAESLTGLAAYQGRLAVFGARSVQIWQIASDPASFALSQVLPNTGTFAPLSVQSLGDLDVLYLYDTGIRSLRVRDSSLNAIVIDIGTPIDQYLQTALLTATSSQKAAACSIIEPSTGRYWCYFAGTIYVLSYHPSNKIVAWGTYLPTYNASGVQTLFVPVKFEQYQGRVYCTDNIALYQYGGTDNNTYDNSVATVQAPFFDLKKPSHNKTAGGIDADVTGNWEIYATSDWINDTMIDAAALTQASFDQNWIPFNATGTHFTMQAKTTGSTAAKISELILHYQVNESPMG